MTQFERQHWLRGMERHKEVIWDNCDLSMGCSLEAYPDAAMFQQITRSPA